ncbi:MAG: hypothetical protein GWP75_03040 [Planctomycetia bacterium]|nr:hypothetical protein [Planctomycetia bacterium]
MKRRLHSTFLVPILGISPLTAIAAAGDDLSVVQTTPRRAVLDAATDAVIQVTFDRAVDPASVGVDTFHAFSRGAGPLTGTLSISRDGRTVSLTPDRDASPGEPVTITLGHGLRGVDGSALRSRGHQVRYWTRAGAGDLQFEIAQSITTRAFPGEDVIPYGGTATDLDGDGWIDLSIVNEATDDVRVFMNAGDATCRVDAFLEPGNAVGAVPSPSEAADFDLDGIPDLCTANIVGDSVSVLLGNGDGTYGPAQTLETGEGARGITALDLDGDGDLDIASSAYYSNNLRLLFNDGTGVFGGLTSLNPGINGEWSIQADDMDGDGLFDLVIGGQSQVRVLLADEDGGFTNHSTRSVSGRTWQLNLADLDGDGSVDVACVNSFADEGFIFLNDGRGGLRPGTSHDTDPFPLASDLGDLDGDGDLDWITSSYGGDWFLFLNDGTGGFEFHSSFDAPIAASCSLPVDMDRDGDLDLVFVDELDDSMIIMSNGGYDPPGLPGDLDGNGSVDGADLGIMLAAWGVCPPTCPPDLDDDGRVDGADLGLLLIDWN